MQPDRYLRHPSLYRDHYGIVFRENQAEVFAGRLPEIICKHFFVPAEGEGQLLFVAGRSRYRHGKF